MKEIINLHLKNINYNKAVENKSKYDNLKEVYKKYIKDMEKSDFANSFTRYQVELNMLKNLKKTAVEENKQIELEFIQEKYNILADKFNQFGVVLKDLD